MKIADNPISKNLAKILGYKEDDPTEFTKNLKIIEKELGINQNSVRNWISGIRNPQIGNLEKLAELFNLSVYELFIDTNRFVNHSKQLSPKQVQLINLIQRIGNEEALDELISKAKSYIIDFT